MTDYDEKGLVAWLRTRGLFFLIWPEERPPNSTLRCVEAGCESGKP